MVRMIVFHGVAVMMGATTPMVPMLHSPRYHRYALFHGILVGCPIVQDSDAMIPVQMMVNPHMMDIRFHPMSHPIPP